MIKQAVTFIIKNNIIFLTGLVYGAIVGTITTYYLLR